MAQVDPARSRIRDRKGGLELELALSQGVPYRIFTLQDPRRVVLDFREVDWSGVQAATLVRSDLVASAAMGGVRPGWSRLVLTLTAPLALQRAALTIDPESGAAVLRARFMRVGDAAFAAAAGAAPDPGWALPAATSGDSRAASSTSEAGVLRILLDPGHGGLDPGAMRDGVTESRLMLSYARTLREALVRAGAEVAMTREDDSFVSLERRVEMAHAMDADLFISLHADALAGGGARGTTVHTLSKTASDEASRKLAERHDRGDILAGVDLSHSDDVVADVLMDLARMETQPRSEALADAVVAALRSAGLPLNSRPRRAAGYSVLKAADIPSILIEVGFLSSDRDRANLVTPEFRARLAGAVRDAVLAWQLADEAEAPLRRQ
ncbi:N-acetylmuramoyl-L-alanine amidase [Pseudooceanicola sediminis]|uniref:N-acetylmuramoyl-L-alanine amidase n=1 Tax=Pseudooceanicola sediminis TaxID=2211117 RepID=A0A399J9H8_9RHOB|nr:N-acetylmuramoyl-L-alanine amidase [Pseudooceanicola sediminis]KAA2314741.1 N-acetylmuramoyl-L-alanine amidase [Puniceibacterium sp. HSS470]RII39306.1 N-acetylmuramoyl-L-alanine amidase [Pseudooceanicola sediminis]|tara:strand:- start:151797 stop:152942 length:1146 start_codon:yes stop_codon:yes gene_type:complete